jgi:hypothetical protein
VDGNEVFEYAARTVDGELEIRSSRGESPMYPAAQWTRDQQALGARVQRRRIIVLDDWSDLPRADRSLISRRAVHSSAGSAT